MERPKRGLSAFDDIERLDQLGEVGKRPIEPGSAIREPVFQQDAAARSHMGEVADAEGWGHSTSTEAFPGVRRRRRERPRRPFAAVEPVEHFHQRRDRPDVPRPIANGFSPFLYRNRKPSSACFVARTFARVARRWSGIVTALWACGVLGGRVAQRSSELTRPVEMTRTSFADKKYPSMAPT